MWTLGRVDSAAASPAKQLPVGSTDTRVRIRAWPPQEVYSQGGSGRDSNSPSSAAHFLPLPTAISRGKWGGTMDSLAKTIWKAEWGFQWFHETKMKFSGPRWERILENLSSSQMQILENQGQSRGRQSLTKAVTQSTTSTREAIASHSQIHLCSACDYLSVKAGGYLWFWARV